MLGHHNHISTLVYFAGRIDEVRFSNVARSCPPSGLVAWWPGDGNATDILTSETGVLTNGATFDQGKVGGCFAVTGFGQGVSVGNPARLQLQSLTIEAWCERGSLTNGLAVLSYGPSGYAFLILGDGGLQFGKAYVDAVESVETINDLAFHHVAITKAGNVVTFYIDGQPSVPYTYVSTFEFTTTAAIGNYGDLQGNTRGLVDEVSVYDRALSASEVQAIYSAGSAGKCR